MDTTTSHHEDLTDQEHLLEEYHEAQTGEPIPDEDYHQHPVDVIVLEPVHVVDVTPRKIVSDQVPLDTVARARIAPRLRTRARLLVTPRGGDAVIGGEAITTGTGYLVKADQTHVVLATDALYALGIAPGVTMHTYAEVREG